MPCKERLEQYLTDQHVPFDVQHHAVAYTAQELAAAEHISGRMVAKSVIVIAGDRMVMLVLPAVHRVDLTRAALITGAPEVRLADEREFAAIFPDCEAGAMPPFGNLYDLPVYVDNALAQNETIVFPAGTHTETMSIRYADYARLVTPALADFRTPAHV
jgi:Ala-tRNA(Pro) deacylase